MLRKKDTTSQNNGQNLHIIIYDGRILHAKVMNYLLRKDGKSLIFDIMIVHRLKQNEDFKSYSNPDTPSDAFSFLQAIAFEKTLLRDLKHQAIAFEKTLLRDLKHLARFPHTKT